MNKGICFFVTPIGEEGSHERKQADALRDNVLTYGCEPFGLEVIRADQIKGDSDINQDVVDYVRNAEICIVDLTGLNPNVMYEFGLRHQTGLPVVILAKKGTKLPFDVISKRTIFFEDVEKADSCNFLIREIRAYIRGFEADGYRKVSSQPTMAEVYALLETIDKKVSTPSVLDTPNATNFQGDVDVDQLLSNLDPSQAFHFAYKTNQLRVAEQLLDLLKDQPYEYYINKVCALATKGSSKAMQELEDLLPKALESASFEMVIDMIGSLVTCYMRRDIEMSKLPLVGEFIEQAYDKAISNRERASILNQKQRMLAGAQQFDEAKVLAEQIIQLNDEEPAYYFNYATILDNLSDFEGAKLQAKKCIEVCPKDKPHEDCLMLACKLFKEASQSEDRLFYEECLLKLEKINPYKARLVRVS